MSFVSAAACMASSNGAGVGLCLGVGAGVGTGVAVGGRDGVSILMNTALKLCLTSTMRTLT